MEIMTFLKNFSFKKNKNTLLIILVTGVLMLFCKNTFFNTQKTDEKNAGPPDTSFCGAYTETEKRLSGMLAKISGAGKTEVMITYESSPEKVTVSDTKTSKSELKGEKSENTGERSTVMQKDSKGDSPFVKTEIFPKVRGVLVVSDGASDENVSANLKKAVCAALSVPLHKVEVMPREK